MPYKEPPKKKSPPKKDPPDKTPPEKDPEFCQQLRAEALADCQDIYNAYAHIKACVFDTITERIANFNAETADFVGGGHLQCAAE